MLAWSRRAFLGRTKSPVEPFGVRRCCGISGDEFIAWDVLYP